MIKNKTSKFWNNISKIAKNIKNIKNLKFISPKVSKKQKSARNFDPN